MCCIEVVFFIRVLSIFYVATTSLSSGFEPIDNYLIDCGSPTNTSIAGRVFLSDYTALKFLSTAQDILANTTEKPSISSSDSPLYRTARIFTKASTYKFPILHQGRHWIRLYFSPFVYETYDMRTARFSVFTENHVLLNDFGTYNTTSLKEFSMNVTSNGLALTLTPSASSFAFLNAIEVVSVPDELITDDFLPIVGLVEQSFKGLSSQAFETVARVNMGGPMVFPENDALWRTWIPDRSFRVHNNTITNVSNVEAVKYPTGGRVTPIIAPAIVYGTAATGDFGDGDPRNFNITWEFEVDQGFLYLIRFHFCDIISHNYGTLFFSLYLNSLIVASDMRLGTFSDYTLGSPLYIDYVTMLAVTNKLRVSVGPHSGPDQSSTIVVLNGLEIMKIMNSMSSNSKKSTRLFIAGVITGALVLVTLSVLFYSIILKNRKVLESKANSNKTAPFALNYGTGIPFLGVQEATNNFDERLVIGSGGFGKVYKGVLNDGTKVAVKRKNPGSQQGLVEFHTEIKMLSRFRHRHLVSLIAYCAEGNEMILVYEYMENGTLRSHLYGSGAFPVLSWKQRLEICIGAARGLHYLHTGLARPIIHRDVKSTNILLDENLKAKVADFGLSKIGPDITQANHVSTDVKGSFGYLDPEYFMMQRLTLKSDIYSFGVVLLNPFLIPL